MKLLCKSKDSGTTFQLLLGPKIQEEPKRGPFFLPQCKELCKSEESYLQKMDLVACRLA
jgi:hypothetical protein